MKLTLLPLLLTTDRDSEAACSLIKAFRQDEKDVLAGFECLPLVFSLADMQANETDAVLILTDDFELLRKRLEEVPPALLSRTVLYGQSDQDRDTLLKLPVAGFVPDRTIDEVRRIARVPGCRPTRLMFVGYGLYGRKEYFVPEAFDAGAMDFTDEGEHGLFVLPESLNKFDLGTTLQRFIEGFRPTSR